MPFFKDEYYALILKIIFISVSGFMIFFILFSDFREIIFRVPDDASYYLKIAQNYNSGNGFSFDGIHKTNGFQPLWQYILIALTFVCRTNAETTLRIVLILQVILLFISSRLIPIWLSLFGSNSFILSRISLVSIWPSLFLSSFGSSFLNISSAFSSFFF